MDKILPSTEVTNCIYYWQKRLNLLNWKVAWVVVEDQELKMPKALMEITPTRLRHYANITIKQSTYDRYEVCSREFQGYIVHELTHLILDPIAEEHMIQTQFHIEKDQRVEHVKRFNRTLEKAVEQIAVTIVAEGPIYDSKEPFKGL